MDSISAEQAPAQREDVVKRFREGRAHMLVCTDLLARGIDFLNVATVVNYDFPLSAVDYVHRCRALRAGLHKLSMRARLCNHLDLQPIILWRSDRANGDHCAVGIAGLGAPGALAGQAPPSPSSRRRMQVGACMPLPTNR